MKTNSFKSVITKSKLALFAVLLGGCLTAIHRADAVTIYGNNIDATNPSAENPFNTGEYSNTGGIDLANSTLTRGSGLAANSAMNRFAASGFNITTAAAAITANKFFSFTITPTAGTTIDFNSLALTEQSSGTGPASYSFRSSVDGFAADIATGTLTTNTTNILSIDLSAAAFDNISSAITFEFIAYGASAVGGSGSVNDFAFDGVVPEPATVLGGLLLVGVAGWTQRRRLRGLAQVTA